MENYEIHRSFRDTLYGKVRYGKHVKSGTMVVIKEYDKARVEKRVTAMGQPIAEDAKNEIRLHASLSQGRHPYLVQMYDVQEDTAKIYTILEYCSKGELFGYVQSQCFSVDLARHYYEQLMQGVKYMHSRNICHLDLSLENLLLNDKEVLKICDFGVATECKDGQLIKNDDPNRRPGKLRYMDPEVFAMKPFDCRSADIYSCSVILFVMLFAVFPYELPSASDERFQYVYTGHVEDLLKLWGKKTSAAAIDLLNRTLCVPSKRLNISEILAHPFIKKEELQKTEKDDVAMASSMSATSSSVSSSSSSSASSSSVFSLSSSSLSSLSSNSSSAPSVAVAGALPVRVHSDTSMLDDEPTMAKQAVVSS